MRVILTVDGDMADRIARAEMGAERFVAALLDANPGLAARGPVLPAGVSVTIPDVARPVAAGTVRLWGPA